MSETTQSSLIANFIEDERVDGIEPIQLVVELLVRIRQDVIFLVGGQHEVGQGASDPIKQQPTLFAFLRLDILGITLTKPVSSDEE